VAWGWSGGAGLGCVGLGVAGSVGRRVVGLVARGRAGGVGTTDARGVGRLGVRGSVDRLDRWVQVMDLWSITLGDK
jgi:hypothetical protein